MPALGIHATGHGPLIPINTTNGAWVSGVTIRTEEGGTVGRIEGELSVVAASIPAGNSVISNAVPPEVTPRGANGTILAFWDVAGTSTAPKPVLLEIATVGVLTVIRAPQLKEGDFITISATFSLDN